MSSSVSSLVGAATQQARRAAHLDIPTLLRHMLALPQTTRAQFMPHPAASPASSAAAASSSSSSATVSSAQQSFPPVWITSQVKDVPLDETRTLQQTYTWCTSSNSYIPFGYPSQLDSIASVPSPSRKLLAVVRAAPAPKGAPPAKVPTFVLEILSTVGPNAGRVLYSASTQGLHGKILLAGHFGGFNWNASETAIVYMAEPNPVDRKSANFFPSDEQRIKESSKKDSSASTPIVKGTENEIREEWGEAMVGLYQPRPFVARFGDVEEETGSTTGMRIYSVKGIPEEVSAGQAIWTGWNEKDYATAKKKESAATSSSSTPAAAEPAASDDTTTASNFPPSFTEGLYLTIYPNNQHGGRKLGIAAYNTRESKVCYLSARYIIDARKEEAEKVAKEAAQQAKELETKAKEGKIEEIALSPKEKEKDSKKKSKNENHLIILTPNDHSACSPRLDGFDIPQLVYVTTDPTWCHISCAKVKTFVTLASTLNGFMKLVEQGTESEEEKKDGDEAAKSMNARGDLVEAYPPSTDPSKPDVFASSMPAGMKVFHSNTHEMIPIVRQPKSIHSFPGFWPYGLVLTPQARFVFDRSHILLHTWWRSKTVVLLCCDEDDSLSRLPFPIDAPNDSSMMLYDVDRTSGRVIIGVSNMETPEALYVGEIQVLKEGENVKIGENFLPVSVVHKDAENSIFGAAVAATAEEEDDVAYAHIKYTLLLAPQYPLLPEIQRRFSKLQSEILQIELPASEKYEDGTQQLPFEAAILTPKFDRNNKSAIPPLIIFPHGGPHASSTTNFIPHVAFHGLVGCAIMYINYRGSTSFGQAALESLPGKCGTQDVQDCMRALEYAIEKFGFDRNNIHVQGGSHGGFLSTHLIGQHPDVFQSSVARNPVVNIAGLLSTTDIPDWSIFEATGAYDPLKMPTGEDYARLFNASPIAHISQVKTPLLMLLGGSDRRVPMAQPLDYVKLLKARGVKTRTLMWQDATHGISETVQMEAEVWVSSVAERKEVRATNLFFC